MSRPGPMVDRSRADRCLEWRGGKEVNVDASSLAEGTANAMVVAPIAASAQVKVLISGGFSGPYEPRRRSS